MAEWRVAPATILDFRRDRTGKTVEYVTVSISILSVMDSYNVIALRGGRGGVCGELERSCIVQAEAALACCRYSLAMLSNVDLRRQPKPFFH